MRRTLVMKFFPELLSRQCFLMILNGTMPTKAMAIIKTRFILCRKRGRGCVTYPIHHWRSGAVCAS